MQVVLDFVGADTDLVVVPPVSEFRALGKEQVRLVVLC
ncbi:hypothetical protein MLGJGCBP_04624 [Rhodococcus sp. T7]|nr:hypothetical protein MLGJGCBP_04624 [Rhodococcus sp. T7]